MRQKIFELLPLVWRRLDTEGTLENFLDIWDGELDTLILKIQELMDIQSPDLVNDRYLRLLADTVGHVWNDDKSYRWNRLRIRDAIARHSYKGTAIAKYDLARLYGASYCEIIDNASLLCAWNLQEGMFLDSNFFHDGAFQLIISDDVDIGGFLEEFEHQKAAGTKWFIKQIPHEYETYSESLGYGEPKLKTAVDLTSDFNFWFDWMPQPPAAAHSAGWYPFLWPTTKVTMDDETLLWSDDEFYYEADYS